MKTGYYLEALTLETMELLGSTKYENSENVPHLIIFGNVTGNLENKETMYFIIEKAKESILGFPEGLARFL